MPSRLVTLLLAGLLAVVGAPHVLAQSGEAIKGVLRNPEGKPVKGVTIVVSQQGKRIGTAKTTAAGAWRVAVPQAGTYQVLLRASTLPKNLQPRTEGGERLPRVDVRPGETRTVIFPLIPTSQEQEQQSEQTAGPSPSATRSPQPGQSGSNTLSRFLQLLLEGLKYGGIIAITAVGLSLVFGTTRLINFAHGELVTIGAMVAFLLSTSTLGPAMPLVGAALVAVVVGALIGGGLELALWRPLRRRNAGLIQMFIISIGLALLLRHAILVVFGSRRQQYAQYTLQQDLNLGPIHIAPRDLIVLLLSLVILLGVALALQRTRIGKATRAVADNKDLAEASGIDVNRVILIVWVTGGGLAAIGGVFYGLTQAVFWDMGFNLLLLMFAAVILGGLGSAYGAVVGSFAIGLVAQLSTLWFPVELQNMWALLALIVVLLVRPQGILGRPQRAG